MATLTPYKLSVRRLVLTIALVVAPALVSAQARPPADALARSLQQRYQGIRDFSADFTHSYRGGALRTETREQGSVSIKKPGRMRWVYTAPEKKEFVSDGTKLYSYIPQDKQVVVSNVPAQDQASSAALFLAGKGDLSRDFTASYVDSPVAGALALKLVPRKNEPDYEYLIVAVDPATLQIRALTTRDRQGGDSTLIFTNMKENRGLSDKEFAFRIPRGVDVVTDGQRN
jgi:outer membrane lipoprotein carrier protein